MNEEIEKLQQDISNSNEIKPHIIDVNLIESQSGKMTNLLNGIDTASEALNNQYYYFKFKEPIYIHRINFTPEEGSNLLGMEIKYIDFKDKESTIAFTKKEHVAALPRKVIKEFKVKPKRKFSGKTKLKKIELYGFLVDELNSIEEKVEEVGNYQTSLQEKLDKLILKNDEYQDKEDRIIELDDAIPTLQENKKTLENQVRNLETKRKSLKEDNQTLKNSTSQLEAKSNNLNKEISIQKTELQKLIRDKNIFSTEMAEYIKQADRHIWTYLTLSLIPWLLIVCISYLVFNKVADLSTIYNTLDDVEVFTIFWTRLPFALITASILFVSYEISKVFVQNMMKIQSQKRIFAKIGIVAKDVADSSILELDNLTDNEKFELRTKLKMDLLKAHLSNDIGENYEYKIKTSLSSHLPKLFNKKTE